MAEATQTSISDLPEWARGYGPQLLGLTEAVAFQKQYNPETKQYDIVGPSEYQKYGGERIAPFSGLQEKAFERAGEMGTSSQLGSATTDTQTAINKALGTSYDPYQMGQFTASTAAQYMNPFVEAAMAPQLREAQRSSEMQRMSDQAQAVRSGAFGGSRQAIVEAERQRNLGMQQGDIRARGYQTAFDQAQQNFAREQQLREQSRQYGAGLGMQGIGLGLQGAGLMGQLGQAQFGQGRDITNLQAQLGTQQQQVGQLDLNQKYQDFLNQQRHPYQQLEFMSNMLRGTPMGTVNTMYAQPPSTLGQIAGLGTGFLGFGQAARMFGNKEGGQVKEYADGGSVTSDYNIDNIIDRLSDAQLQQARMAAINNKDMRRLQAIDEELAERASVRSGLGGAFNSLPEETQESVTNMAEGGIVAFAGPNEANNYNLVEDPQFGGSSSGSADMDRLRIESERARRAAQEHEARMKFLRESAPETYQRLLTEQPNAPAQTAPARVAPAQAPRTAQAAPQAARRDEPRRSATITRQEARSAVETIAQGNNVEIPKDDTKELTEQFMKEFSAKSAPERAEVKADLEKAKSRAKEIEARGIGEAMMRFGFGMAAAASKPGAGTGLGGALRSAAAASPIFAESLAETNKLKQAAEDNYTKLRMENRRYENALDQGNMQLASSLANNINQRKLAQANLERQIVQQDRLFELEKQKAAFARSQAGRPGSSLEMAYNVLRADPKNKDKSNSDLLEDAARKVGFASNYRTDVSADIRRQDQLRKDLGENMEYKKLGVQMATAKTPEERLSIQQRMNVIEADAARKIGIQPSGGVGSPTQVYRFDSKGNPIQ
jgi:hypothetical protein